MRVPCTLLIREREGKVSMHTTGNLQHGIALSQNCLSYKNKLITLNSSLKFEKIIFVLNAIFEGIGIAGIISAAFWYATAPMAPDGFKGPIATLTIASSTIASLIIAIPIAYSSYKRTINALQTFYTEFLIESTRFDDCLEELHFELLKLRSLCNTDDNFLAEIKPLILCDEIELTALSVCKVYSILKNKHFSIKWDSSTGPSIHEDTNSVNSMQFKELLAENALTSIKAFRKKMIKYTFKLILNSQLFNQFIPAGNRLKHMSHALAAGITCTEVLLSIGWTVASILIGIKVIAPISTHHWIIFAFICLGVGPLFAIGIYFNKLKEANRNAQKNEIRKQNNVINEARIHVDTLLAKKLFEQKNVVRFKLSNADLTAKNIKFHRN